MLLYNRLIEMNNKKTMARMNRSTLAELAKYKLVPQESYDNILARLLGMRKPSKEFTLKGVKQ